MKQTKKAIKQKIYNEMVANFTTEQKEIYDNQKTGMKDFLDQCFKKRSFDYDRAEVYLSKDKTSSRIRILFLVLYKNNRITVMASRSSYLWYNNEPVVRFSVKHFEIIRGKIPDERCLYTDIDITKWYAAEEFIDVYPLGFILDNEGNLPAIMSVPSKTRYYAYNYVDGKQPEGLIPYKRVNDSYNYIEMTIKDISVYYHFDCIGDNIILYNFNLINGSEKVINYYKNMIFMFNNGQFVKYTITSDGILFEHGEAKNQYYKIGEIKRYRFNHQGNFVNKYTTWFKNGYRSSKKTCIADKITKQTANNLLELDDTQLTI